MQTGNRLLSTMKTYILQRDLPNMRKGHFFVPCRNEKGVEEYFSFVPNGNGAFITFDPEYVENNSEWFLPEENN